MYSLHVASYPISLQSILGISIQCLLLDLRLQLRMCGLVITLINIKNYLEICALYFPNCWWHEPHIRNLWSTACTIFFWLVLWKFILEKLKGWLKDFVWKTSSNFTNRLINLHVRIIHSQQIRTVNTCSFTSTIKCTNRHKIECISNTVNVIFFKLDPIPWSFRTCVLWIQVFNH